jgi:hypothetical protein
MQMGTCLWIDYCLFGALGRLGVRAAKKLAGRFAIKITAAPFRYPKHSFNGDGRLLRLGLQAYALGIAYEFDPYFGLSISRVDEHREAQQVVGAHRDLF